VFFFTFLLSIDEIHYSNPPFSYYVYFFFSPFWRFEGQAFLFGLGALGLGFHLSLCASFFLLGSDGGNFFSFVPARTFPSTSSNFYSFSFFFSLFYITGGAIGIDVHTFFFFFFFPPLQMEKDYFSDNFPSLSLFPSRNRTFSITR